MSILYFDICAFILCAFLAITIMIHKTVRLHQNQLFFYTVYLVMFATLGSLVEGLGSNRVIMGMSDFFTQNSVLDAGSYLYLACHIAVSVMFMVYSRAVMDIYATRISDVIFLYLPVIIAYTCLLINPLNNGVFIHENGLYRRGDLMIVFYIVGAWYISVAMYNIIKYRRSILPSAFTSFIAFTALSVLGVIIQMAEHSMKIENLMNALSMLIFYMTIERPGDYIDSVTGLQNDLSFYVNSSIRIRRGREARYIAISIDNMDFVESSIGNEAATEILKKVAQYLDTLTREAVTYRLGRDVFVMMVKEKSKLNHIMLMQELRRRFSAPFTADKYSIVLFECKMYLNWPNNVNNAEDLRRMLEIFADKSRHKMRHEIEARSINLETDRRHKEIDVQLRTVIDDERFCFKYQPIKDVRTGKFDAAEMKPMIDSPTMGFITTNEYYPIASENGTAVAIAKHIIDVCFTYLSEYSLLGSAISQIAIPIPSAFLVMKNSTEWVIEKAQEKGIDPGYVTFEISENALILNSDVLKDNITGMDDYGFSFMLTDFGNGYTDVEMMLKMHLREVGINRDLISSAPLSRKADILVRCAVDMMKRQSIKVRASGIDSEELEAYAVNAGVDKVQGFQLARFFSGAEFIAFLARQNGAECEKEVIADG